MECWNNGMKEKWIVLITDYNPIHVNCTDGVPAQTGKQAPGTIHSLSKIMSSHYPIIFTFSHFIIH